MEAVIEAQSELRPAAAADMVLTTYIALAMDIQGHPPNHQLKSCLLEYTMRYFR